MGSFRRGLIAGLAVLPGTAWAEMCTQLRPGWDGTPATQVTEALGLFTSPLVLFLLAALGVAVAFRHAMGTALVALLWSFFISYLILPDQSGLRAAAVEEGCIASPTLFIALSAAICTVAVIYTFRREKRL
ncbi:hypothetical protein PGB28_14410 [Primorskyibacter aestuariivivens]|uniref:hypothetical protein n=1 Tax=Primorskyibacter aestuariivivens TaxID=1888912 RepID=UPI002301BBFC|nr:hypothetical protein [Primorskyibacter aestuariivivens]MDA7429658.1 hypothetical protein [Primorskyibacter aestuariivivens]